MDNLKLWNSVEKTNPDYTSTAEISGRRVTSIDAYAQIKQATEEFGVFGETWGLKDTSMEFKEIGETVLCVYKANFFAPKIEFPMYNSIKVAYRTQGVNGYLKVDDEFAKKIETNTITKALTRLGFNTDVFMGKFEDSRYVEEVTVEFQDLKMKEYEDKLKNAKDLKHLQKIFSSLPVTAKAKFEKLKDELKTNLK